MALGCFGVARAAGESCCLRSMRLAELRTPKGLRSKAMSVIQGIKTGA